MPKCLRYPQRADRCGWAQPATCQLRPVSRILAPVAREPVSVRLHYMVGNHDWYYHLPGPAFEAIRQEIVEAFGLSNPARAISA